MAIINQPSLIDSNGNITVHGRAGFRIPVRFKDGDGNPQDTSAAALFFEVSGKFRKALEPAGPGFTSDVRWITVTQAEAALLPSINAPARFVVIDESYVEPDSDVVGVARWQGTIGRTGFNTRPEDAE